MRLTVSVLCVCSGNICRSPLAEGLLREALRDAGDFEFSSAGVVAGEGEPVTLQTLSLGLRLGVDLSEHHAHYLTEHISSSADVIFAMSRSHRRAVVELSPKRVSRTFTIREFARLGMTLTDFEVRATVSGCLTADERVLALVALVASRRGQTDPPLHPDDDDVVDPYRRDDSTYDRSAAELLPAVREVSRLFAMAARAQ